MFSLKTIRQMNSRAAARTNLAHGRFARGRNCDIPLAWYNGNAMRSSNGNFWTNGTSIYSYHLRIGITNELGRKIAHNFTSTPRRGANGTVIPPHPISPTTSKHQSYVIRQANYVVESAPHYYGGGV